MVKDSVMKCIAEQAGVDLASVKPESELANHLGMDSLDTIELVMALEEEFDILIADDQADACKTVADVIALVESLSPKVAA